MKKIVQEKSEGKTEKRYKKYWEENPHPIHMPLLQGAVKIN
ncbi:hypothetical protein [Providencia sp. PROV202]|nr:hypothetical protein [Providencia sp. PROV202]